MTVIALLSRANTTKHIILVHCRAPDTLVTAVCFTLICDTVT